MRRMIFAVAFALAFVKPSAGVAAQPELRFSGNVVTVSGERGATYVVFAVGLEPLRYGNRLYRQQLRMTDADNDGLAVEQLRVIPRRSVWVVADAATGEHTFGAPDGFTFAVEPFVGQLAAVGGRSLKVRGNAELLVLRPGSGSWHRIVSAGGPLDTDPSEEGVAVDLTRLQEIGAGETAAPQELRLDDLFVTINTDDLTLAIGRVGR